MSTTYRQNRDFAENAFGDDMLDQAIDWMRQALGPEEVSEEDALRQAVLVIVLGVCLIGLLLGKS